MPTYKKKENFATTEDGINFRLALVSMVSDTAFDTDSSYSANSELYPDNQIPFVNKHMEYMQNHPSLDSQQYLANLRLMTRKR